MNCRRNEKATCPATKKAIVVRRATGQLRKVPAKTPMAVRTIAWSQTPKSPLKKFVPKLPALARMYRSLSAMPRYWFALMQRTSIRRSPREPASSEAGNARLLV